MSTEELDPAIADTVSVPPEESRHTTFPDEPLLPSHKATDTQTMSQARRMTSRRTSAVATLVGDAYDNEFIHDVVEDAGRWAFGVVSVEVWVMNASKTHLIRPESGWWMDPYALDLGANHSFDRLIDSSREDYLPPLPLSPGCGLAGALYSELQRGNMAATYDRTNPNTQAHIASTRSGITNDVEHGVEPETSTRKLSTRKVGATNLLASRVVWRDIQSLADDPDQPYNPRLQFIAEAGLGWAAGVPFKIGSSEGLVVYAARSTANLRQLADPINTQYLIHATLLIGSAYALRGPRLEAEKAHKEHMHQTMQRVMHKLTALRKMEKTLESFVREESSRPGAGKSGEKVSHRPSFVHGESSQGGISQVVDWIANKLSCVFQKSKGANLKAPPPFNWRQTMWTFGGAFFTLLILTNVNKILVEQLGSEYSIVLGPFGALMTLQFGLTAAPASQPRNAIVGQTVSLLIAHGIGQTSLEPWLQQTLATSLATGAMVKLGLTHPPAGAAALLFSTGMRTWKQVGMMILGNVIAILCATLINNLCDQRQYPTFWGLKEVNEALFLADDETNERKKKKAV